VKDGKQEHITREPEQVKAFRDTWRDGVHSYLSYIRDRLTMARELLAESGSIFVQIGDENVHRVRSVMDEVFGDENFVAIITVQKTGATTTDFISDVSDFILWYGKDRDFTKSKKIFAERDAKKMSATYIQEGDEQYQSVALTSSHEYSKGKTPCNIDGILYSPNTRYWSTSPEGIQRLKFSGRILSTKTTIRYKMYFSDFPVIPITNIWNDLMGAQDVIYVVQTNQTIIQRCILMTTDPGDLVLDPTCGSGTTAYVAEQWGRRWITIDTSRVALALARARLMGARYPFYLLADSGEGYRKELELGGGIVTSDQRSVASDQESANSKTKHSPLAANHYSNHSFYNRIRHGFVYERVPHITLKSIANNAEIDVIYEKYRGALADALGEINALMRGADERFTIESGARKGKTIDFGAVFGKTETLPSGEAAAAGGLLEWEVPPPDREALKRAAKAVARFWKARIQRQKEIDASIAAKAEFEYLYDSRASALYNL
jgi:adenine-specific DNA-methyltransferase